MTSSPARLNPEALPAASLPDPDQPEVLGGVQVGLLFGVPIYVQPWWLLAAAVLLTVFMQPNTPDQVGEVGSYLLALSFTILLYASVLVHELSHSVVALRLGMRVRRINLQVLGGVSEIEDEAPSAGKEFAVAFAGPALTFVVAAAGYLLANTLEAGSVSAWMANAIFQANLVVGIFNLLPGLPLDGGRVLQSAMWRLTGSRHRGVVAGAWGGRLLSILLLFVVPAAVLLGRRPSVVLLLLSVGLAAFLWLGAGQALRNARFRRMLPSLYARMLSRRLVAVPAETSVAEALRQAIIGRAEGIVVFKDGNPYGLANVSAVRALPEGRRRQVQVGELARRLEAGLVLSAELRGEHLLRALQASPATEYLLIEEDGTLSGLLVATDVERATVGW